MKSMTRTELSFFTVIFFESFVLKQRGDQYDTVILTCCSATFLGLGNSVNPQNKNLKEPRGETFERDLNRHLNLLREEL